MFDLPQNTWQSLFEAQWANEPMRAPESLQQWLSHEGSLIEQLSDHGSQSVNELLLHQTMCFASAEAALKLGVDEGASLLHREAVLCEGDTPLVFTCSLLPEMILTGPFEELRQLEDTSLDSWLITNSELIRADKRFAELSSDDALFVRLSHLYSAPVKVWGRTSIFEGAAAPLLVSEFWLPPSS